MNWMTFLWPMMIGACVTLGLISLRIAFGDGPRLPYLFFALSAFAIAIISGFEIALLRTTELGQYEMTLRWAVVPIFLMVASVTGFVWSFFGTGRAWLALLGVALNGAAQLANLLCPVPAVRHAVALHQVETLGGVKFTVPTITNGPWNIVELASVMTVLVFVLDASIGVWRRGERRRALLVGGGVFIFFIIARGDAVLVEGGYVQTPYLVSFAFAGVLVAVALELSNEVLSAARLSQMLRESEQRMSLAAESAKLGMWVWDADRDEVWMTEPGRAIYGFKPEQPLRYQAFVERAHPEDRAARDAAVKQALATDGSYALEYRVLLPDGAQRWLLSRGRSLKNGNGMGKRLLGVSMDITAQKQAEFQARRQREEMAHLSRVSMMGQLASALAHELNQPLGAILRNAEAAELFLENDRPDLDELRNIVADIRKDDQRAGDVIDRLRSLLKRRDIESVPLVVNELLRDVVSLTRADAAARQVTLEIETLLNLPQVRADRVHLQQVLLNLLLNAMDALNDAPAGKKRVTLQAHRNGDNLVEIAVSDTGGGIAPDRLPQVFEPFFTTKAQGMGMGLAISRTIIEAHGGMIWAENNADGGATFRFTLAAAENGAAA
jgi:PAS domain S-box-containing protein